MPQRAGRRLNARNVPGVWLAANVAVRLQIGEQLILRQVPRLAEHRVQRQRAVALTEHKAVTVRLRRIMGVVVHNAPEVQGVQDLHRGKAGGEVRHSAGVRRKEDPSAQLGCRLYGLQIHLCALLRY